MHGQDDTAEAKTVGRRGAQKFVFGHEFAAEDAIDCEELRSRRSSRVATIPSIPADDIGWVIDPAQGRTCYFDFDVVFQETLQVVQ